MNPSSEGIQLEEQFIPSLKDVSVEFISPEDAALYLELNENNRWKKQRKIEAFARDMVTGAWDWNGETIKFDTEGKLIDGQNRLNAVVQSGVGQHFLVVHNVQRSAQATIDTGTARTFGDALKMRGYSDAQLLAGVVRLLWLWDQGERAFRASRRSPTFAELSQTLEAHPDLQNYTKSARALTQTTTLTPSVAGFVLYTLSKLDHAEAEEFFTRLRSLVDLQEDSPVLQLHRALDRLHTRVHGNASYMLDEQIGLIFKAWNRWRMNLPTKLLKYSPGGARPEVFPEPI